MSNHSFIRLIGDKILHQPGRLFPSNYEPCNLRELERQISLAKERLIEAGGGGIAANQCAEIESPYRFAIVGIFYERKEHLSRLNARYPGVAFPPAVIMVNPHVLFQSEETQIFTHACLSLPCPNRCEIASPKSIRVAYQDPQQNLKLIETEFEGMAAVVLWHELNHILEGRTYLDTALAALSREDLNLFYRLIEKELARRKDELLDLSSPQVSISVDERGESNLNPRVLAEVLAMTSIDVLTGMNKRVWAASDSVGNNE